MWALQHNPSIKDGNTICGSLNQDINTQKDPALCFIMQLENMVKNLLL